MSHVTDCEGLRSGVPGELCEEICEEILVTNSVGNNPSNGETGLNSDSAPPPLSHLDFGVIGSLPPEIFSELNEIYGGKLDDFVAKSKSKGKGTSLDLITKTRSSNFSWLLRRCLL